MSSQFQAGEVYGNRRNRRRIRVRTVFLAKLLDPPTHYYTVEELNSHDAVVGAWDQFEAPLLTQWDPTPLGESPQISLF
jgi:hypothetical protein